MIDITKLKNDDLLVFKNGKNVIFDARRRNTKDIRNIKRCTRKVIRNGNVIYNDNQYKNKVKKDLLKKGDIIITFDNKKYECVTNHINADMLKEILKEAKKIIRNDVVLAKRKTYKHSLQFNDRYAATLKQKNMKA